MSSIPIQSFVSLHPSFHEDSDVLSRHTLPALVAVAGFVLLNTVVTTAYIVAFNNGSPDVSPGVQFLASGIGLLVPVGALWLWFDAHERMAAFPFHIPSTAEIGWALAFVPLGIAASTLGIEATTTFGFTAVTFGYDLTDPLTAVGVLVGPVLLAPLLEEALFRGLLIGTFVDRGWSPFVAGLVALLVFAGLHVWLGVAGMIGIAVWTVFPTMLRLRFDNLAGAYLLHLLNNVYSYVLVVVLL